MRAASFGINASQSKTGFSIGTHSGLRLSRFSQIFFRNLSFLSRRSLWSAAATVNYPSKWQPTITNKSRTVTLVTPLSARCTITTTRVCQTRNSQWLMRPAWLTVIHHSTYASIKEHMMRLHVALIPMCLTHCFKRWCVFAPWPLSLWRTELWKNGLRHFRRWALKFSIIRLKLRN